MKTYHRIAAAVASLTTGQVALLMLVAFAIGSIFKPEGIAWH